MNVVSTGAGVLDAWIDWNGDGDFADSGEQIVSNRTVAAGLNTFNITTPANARVGLTSARFRLSVAGPQLIDTLSIGGEVEDYLIEIVDGTPPVGVTDTYGVDEDQVLTVPARGVLANDTDVDTPVAQLSVFDPDPSTPTVEPVSGPTNGTLVLNRDGSFTYTPNLDFFGTTGSFTW